MEQKTANWLELGIKPYSEFIQMQDTLVELRKKDLIPDTIISVQHPLCVSFGADKKNNQFSDSLLKRVFQKYENTNHESIISYLNENGIDFSTSSRGGGATIFAPGQFNFYPIVDHQALTGKDIDLTSYKSKIYRCLFDSLSILGVSGINVGSQESFATRNERKDIWIVRDGVTHKMGSKGISLNGKVAYHGFSLYVQKEGLAHSWMVNPCGYKPHEVKLWSVEEELGRRINPREVHASAKKAISQNFGYFQINQTSLRDLEVQQYAK